MIALTLTPHLFFGGNCWEAMTFYQRIFGGELTLTPFGDGPPEAHKDPKANSEEMKDKIMYGQLRGAVNLSASDNPHNTDTRNTGQFSLALTGSDADALTGHFDKLAENGQITAPLIQQFWGDRFGMVTDAYGINWMITISANSAQTDDSAND